MYCNIYLSISVSLFLFYSQSVLCLCYGLVSKIKLDLFLFLLIIPGHFRIWLHQLWNDTIGSGHDTRNWWPGQLWSALVEKIPTSLEVKNLYDSAKENKEKEMMRRERSKATTGKKRNNGPTTTIDEAVWLVICYDRRKSIQARQVKKERKFAFISRRSLRADKNLTVTVMM